MTEFPHHPPVLQYMWQLSILIYRGFDFGFGLGLAFAGGVELATVFFGLTITLGALSGICGRTVCANSYIGEHSLVPSESQQFLQDRIFDLLGLTSSPLMIPKDA